MLFEIILNRMVGLSCYHLSPSTDNIIFYHDNKIEMCTNVLHTYKAQGYKNFIRQSVYKVYGRYPV